jgi:hypothetical protein
MIVDSTRVNLLKEYVINEIKGIHDYRGADDSLTKYIAIFNICINVYYLTNVGAFNPILTELLAKNYAVAYTGRYNICWFAIGVYEKHYQTEKNKLDHKSLEAQTKEEWRNFVFKDNKEALNLSTNSPKFQKLASEYKGFNLTDIEAYQRWKNYNVRLYDYNFDLKRYFLKEVYDHPEPNKDTKTVNVAIIPLDTGPHAIFLKDIEKATSYVICPKCNYAIFQVQKFYKGKQYHSSAFSKHLQKCDGKQHKETKLVVRDSKPYAPHLTNKTLRYLTAHERENEFKPRQYYITWDFETMEEKAKVKVGNTSEILAIIHPLSVAATVYTKNYTKHLYKDIRDGPKFITLWIAEVFKEAEQVRLDNAYKDPAIPFDNFVPIIGFNSSRFDSKLIYKFLHNPPYWSFKSSMGDSAYKMITVQKGLANYEDDSLFGDNDDEEDEPMADNDEDDSNQLKLKFLDLLNFVSPSTLEKVVKDFGGDDLKKNEMKGCFAYEAFDSIDVFEVLSSTNAFSRDEFYSYLKKAVSASPLRLLILFG